MYFWLWGELSLSLQIASNVFKLKTCCFYQNTTLISISVYLKRKICFLLMFCVVVHLLLYKSPALWSAAVAVRSSGVCVQLTKQFSCPGLDGAPGHAIILNQQQALPECWSSDGWEVDGRPLSGEASWSEYLLSSTTDVSLWGFSSHTTKMLFKKQQRV